MKNKRVGVIILAIVVLGGVSGGISYKKYSQKLKQQQLEIQNTKTEKIKDLQIKENQQAQTKFKQKQVKEKDLIHSNFEFKVQSYVAEFRKSKDDIRTFNVNLDSINSADLNADDKAQLANLHLAAEDWIMLKGYYDYVRQAGNTHPEESLKYAKEALDKVNTDNLITTGMMSKDTVDKYISFLKEYVENSK